jgi:hypothetical protein
MQLDMMQHCYLIMHQCLSEKKCKGKLYIEFRMGSVPNPNYNPKDKRSKSRITTTFGIVYISQPSAGEGTQLVEWIISLQKRIKCRMQRKGTNTRHVILQGPYTIGITLDRYQDIPPTFHTTAGSLSSDPIICLLNVPPCFQEPLGETLDKLSEMLATNMILSMQWHFTLRTLIASVSSPSTTEHYIINCLITFFSPLKCTLRLNPIVLTSPSPQAVASVLSQL